MLHKETLRLLKCPKCDGEIELQKVKKFSDREIISGNVKCHNCDTSFLIKDGILNLTTYINPSLQEEIDHWNIAAKINNWVPADHEISRMLRPSINEIISEVMKYWDKNENAVVLEICCGEGTAISILPDVAQKVNYIGIDISMGMLLKAKMRKRSGWTIDFIRADANKQLLKAGIVDLCFSFAALHHLEPFSAIRSISSQLRDGGYFILYEPNKYNLFRAIGHNFIKEFYTSSEKPLSPFKLCTIARSFKMIPIKEQGLYPIGLPFSFFISFLKQKNFLLAEKLKTLTSSILFVDYLLSRNKSLSLLLSSSIFQCFMKENKSSSFESKNG